MVTADAFVAEFEIKNENSFKRLLAGYWEGVTKEGFSVADLLRVEMKYIVEATEVAALWLADSETLEAKIELGIRCGDSAKQYRALAARLGTLGVDVAAFDPQFGGYSKMFAFHRSLQTTEERAAASPLTLRALNVARMRGIAKLCDETGDSETARLYRDVLITDEEHHIHTGRQALLGSATAEESQARARRASFRTIEILGEVLDPVTLRKFLSRSLRKPAGSGPAAA